MSEEEKKAYVAEAAPRLMKAIGGKLGEIRAMISAESERMDECGGAEARESILCALDCTYDQASSALGGWGAGGPA